MNPMSLHPLQLFTGDVIIVQKGLFSHKGVVLP